MSYAVDPRRDKTKELTCGNCLISECSYRGVYAPYIRAKNCPVRIDDRDKILADLRETELELRAEKERRYQPLTNSQQNRLK